MNDRLLSEQAMDRSDRSNYSTTVNSFGNGASAKSAADDCGTVCPFVDPAEGWSIEYSEVVCDVSYIIAG